MLLQPCLKLKGVLLFLTPLPHQYTMYLVLVVKHKGLDTDLEFGSIGHIDPAEIFSALDEFSSSKMDDKCQNFYSNFSGLVK